jgi:hypothetical protein
MKRSVALVESSTPPVEVAPDKNSSTKSNQRSYRRPSPRFLTAVKAELGVARLVRALVHAGGATHAAVRASAPAGVNDLGGADAAAQLPDLIARLPQSVVEFVTVLGQLRALAQQVTRLLTAMHGVETG